MHAFPDHTRRMFLAKLAGAIGTPMLLASCGGSSTPAPVAAEVPPVNPNLDDVEDAAFFRPPIPAQQPIVRVRVMKPRTGDGGPKSVTIGSPGQWVQVRVEPLAPPSDTEVFTQLGPHPAAAQAPLVVGRDPSGWSIVDAVGLRINATIDDTIEIRLHNEVDGELKLSPDSRSSGEVRRYRGSLKFVPRPDLAIDDPRAFDVVNHLLIEDYLPGVLAGELYHAWQLETFAAQCISARSFAATEAAVFANRRHYDVSNTASSQMYLGTIGHERSLEAVRMTRGLYLAHEQLLVSGYYSSCCGGVAASARDAIGPNPVNDAVPLQGRSGSDVCGSAPVYQWKTTQSIDLLTRRIVAFGKDRTIKDLIGMARLASVEECATNAHGRPTRMRLTDANDVTIEMSAENFRRAANFSGPNLSAPTKPLLSSNCKASFGLDLVTFEGFGFGHGVGLCQHGAEIQAKAGEKHLDIVKWYYPGAEIVQGYS